MIKIKINNFRELQPIKHEFKKNMIESKDIFIYMIKQQLVIKSTTKKTFFTPLIICEDL